MMFKNVCVRWVALISAILINSSLAFASEIDVLTLAREIVSSIDSNQPKSIAHYLADNIVFEDPTFGSKIIGKEKVFQAYQHFTSGAHNVKRIQLDEFATGNVVVFYSIVAADLEVSADERVGSIGKYIRALEFKNHKLIRHLEFANYDEALADYYKALATKQD